MKRLLITLMILLFCSDPAFPYVLEVGGKALDVGGIQLDVGETGPMRRQAYIR